MPFLHTLNYCGVPCELLWNILPSMAHLVDIHLINLPLDRSPHSLFHPSAVPRLKHLNIPYSRLSPECTREQILAFVDELPALRTLNLGRSSYGETELDLWTQDGEERGMTFMIDHLSVKDWIEDRQRRGDLEDDEDDMMADLQRLGEGVYDEEGGGVGRFFTLAEGEE